MATHNPPGRRTRQPRGEATAAPSDRPGSARQRRNVWVSGRRTSVSLELAVWDALREICGREERSMDGICSLIDERRQRASLASSLRIFALAYFRAIASRYLARGRRGIPGEAARSMLAVALSRLPGRKGREADGRSED